MNPPQAISLLLLFAIIIFLDYVSAQSPPPPLYPTNDLFKPSLVITTGVFSVVFTLTFALLVYSKCFHNDLRSETDEEREIGRLERLWQGRFNQSFSRLSGLNRTAIESLPFFRFSALKGSKQGLECSVCLSKFEDVEILRLLPKCKHAFHIECIDHWLEQHATCPLCRNRVSIEDELSVCSVLGCSSSSLRIMNQLSETREEDSNMEIYIEREEGASDGSSRFGSFRNILKFGKNDKSLSLVEQGNEKRMHKFRHRIVFPDVVFKNRWSNVTPSDLTRLTSNMLGSMSSDRFSSMDRVQRGGLRDKEEVDMKRMVKNKDSTRRAVSEITAVPRLSVLEVTTATRDNAVGGSDIGLVASTSRSDAITATEERRRQLWLPIARKTAHWFVNREKMNELNTTKS